MKALKMITKTIDYAISVACFILMIKWGHPFVAFMFLWLSVIFLYNYSYED